MVTFLARKNLPHDLLEMHSSSLTFLWRKGARARGILRKQTWSLGEMEMGDDNLHPFGCSTAVALPRCHVHSRHPWTVEISAHQ